MLPRTRLCPLLALVLLLRLASAAQDLCFSDPRHSATSPPCAPTHTQIHLRRLPSNPFHALHDYLWAVTHYLSHCAAPASELVLDDRVGNLSLCHISSPQASLPAADKPLWAHCVLAAVARKLNIPMRSAADRPTLAGPPRPNAAFCPRHVRLATPPRAAAGAGVAVAHYRGLSYLTRDCGPGGTCAGSALRGLEERYVRAAFATIRAAVQEEFLPADESRLRKRRLNVLLYDRADTARRQWTNAKEVYRRLRKDPRVDVRFVRGCEDSVAAQGALYFWADVVVAAHGAAMANTVFMREGTEVVEVMKGCQRWKLASSGLRLQIWTGWNAPLLGINMAYVPCDVDEGALSRKQKRALRKGTLMKGTDCDYPRKTRLKEIAPIVDAAVQRQMFRVEADRSIVGRRDGKNWILQIGGRRFLYAELGVYGTGILLFAVLNVMRKGWFVESRRQKLFDRGDLSW